MTRRLPLWGSDNVGVHRVDHPCDHDDHEPFEEVAGRFIVSFVEKGRFNLEVGERRWQLGAGDIMLSHPGMRFRVSHVDGDFSDVCLSVSFNGPASAAFDRARSWARFGTAVVRASNRLRYLHWGITRAVDRNTPMLAETCASELFREIPYGDERSAPRPGTRTFRSYAERIHAARERLELACDEDHRLSDLARASGMSTFHFARLFNELVGVPPHRYLLEARLRAAAEMLRDGRSVTETCFACGFNNLSHFSRRFARRFGHSPSKQLPKFAQPDA